MRRVPSPKAPIRRWAALLAVGLMLVSIGLLAPQSSSPRPAAAATSLAGSQGTDASLKATPSATTVSVTQGPFKGLQVSVNQTADLTDQAISVTWTGGVPTFTGAGPGFSGFYGGDYLQLMQCWSKDATTTPLPEQCEFGGESNNASAYPTSQLSHAYDRAISVTGWTCGSGSPTGCQDFTQTKALATSSNGTQAYLDPNTGWVLDPFRAVDGACSTAPCFVEASVNYNCCQTYPWKSFDTNPYFNYTTTNEVDFARTFPDGTGQQLFTAATGARAPGLGCGEPTLTNSDGSPATPQCWLVVVPRGTPAEENFTGDAQAQLLVDTSPLTSTAWANRMSVPLQFASLSAGCPLSGNVRRIVGSELAAPAIASWQPILCQTAGNPPYSYAPLSDDSARSQLLGSAAGGAGMVVMSNPIDPSTLDPTNPVVYAPLTLSGAVIGFNVERLPARPGGVDVAEEVPFIGTQVQHVYLTPRLVAKLLTESYRGQIFSLSASTTGAYAWALTNPLGLVEDPDFVQSNPEFAELRQVDAVDSSGLVLEEPSSDAAGVVWNWILSDPEATNWLNGEADPWGMVVNPYYTTNATKNPSGVAFGQPPPNDYPKADPYCWQDADLIGGTNQTARPLCMQDWSPYVNAMRDAAAATRSANSGAKLIFNPGATGPDTAWTANGPQRSGQYFILSITDTANAARYGLQTAALSRSGDDGLNRAFVAADPAGLLAGEQAMKASSVAGIRLPNPAATATGAYPLTMLTYAAALPVGLDQTARTDYATFITYAAGAGETSGFSPGNLPPGYVSLPSDLVAQATAAAATILNPPTPTTTTTTTSTTLAPTSTTTVAPAAAPRTTTGPAVAVASSRPSSSPPTATTTTTMTSPAVAPVSTVAPERRAQPQRAPARSPATPVGVVRFAVPLGLVIGLVAAAGGVTTQRRQTRAV